MGSNEKLDELEALFDEDEFDDKLLTEDHQDSKNASNSDMNDFSQNNEDAKKTSLSDLEEQYQQLQKQMQLIKEKIESNKPVSTSQGSCLSEMNKPELKPHCSEENKKQKFLSAFACGFDENNLEADSANTADKSMTQITSSTSVVSTSEKYIPPQKKRRITHNPTLTNNKINTVKASVKKATQSSIPTQFYQPCNPKSRLQSRNLKNSTQHSIDIEDFSKIRLKQRYLSASEFKQRMDGKTHVKLSLLRPTLKLSDDTDWVTIAVVAKQLDPQTTKNGKKFSIWHLTDLSDCTKHVAFFLFGRVHEQLWKNITIGTVIGLLNPSIMPPKRDNSDAGNKFDNSPALTVDVAERVMKIGVACDLGWCMATKFRNKQPAGKCLAFINKQYGDVCIFHMQKKYKKTSSKRGELQSPSAPSIASKYKNTLWNKVKGEQFFYGGQTFSAAPPSSNPNVPRMESKMKLTKIFSSVNNQSVGSSSSQATEEKSKIMQAISGIDGGQKVSGCSDTFAEMLASGDMVAGSRQFLHHLQKKNESKEQLLNQTSETNSADTMKQQNKVADDRKNGTTSTISAATLLKQQKELIDRRKKLTTDQTSSSKATTTNVQQSKIHFTTVSDIKKSTEILMQMKRERRQQKLKQNNSTASSCTKTKNLSLAGSVAPRLGSDVREDKQVDLFGELLSTKRVATVCTPSLAELRKRKALAKLRNEAGNIEIKKPDPNLPLIGQVKEIKNNDKLKTKLKERVEQNRNDLKEENKENHLQKATEVFGKSNLSEEEFKKILNASSMHSNELELEEMERQEEYFNPLIKKEMMENKMAETFEITSKVVICHDCDYTFWAAHERCKQLNHALQWKDVKKKFFECTNCKQRTTTWEPYPTKPCRECGSEKKWRRTCMLKISEKKMLDSELLLIRGVEHSKFLNALT